MTTATDTQQRHEKCTCPDWVWEHQAWCPCREEKMRPVVSLPNPCIYTPARCNGGGYDGCACGPYDPDDKGH